MAPLLYVAAGSLHLGEQLSVFKKIATGLGMLAIYPLLLGSDLPAVLVAGLLSSSIVAYGLLRKKGTLGPVDGLFLESLVLTPAAVLFLMWNSGGHLLETSFDLGTILLLVAAGPVTLLPLLFFAVAVQELPLSTVGFLQYLSPTLQFLLAISVFHEALDGARLCAFILVLLGILVLLTGQFLCPRTIERVVQPE